MWAWCACIHTHTHTHTHIRTRAHTQINGNYTHVHNRFALAPAIRLSRNSRGERISICRSLACNSSSLALFLPLRFSVLAMFPDVAPRAFATSSYTYTHTHTHISRRALGDDDGCLWRPESWAGWRSCKRSCVRRRRRRRRRYSCCIVRARLWIVRRDASKSAHVEPVEERKSVYVCESWMRHDSH